MASFLDGIVTDQNGIAVAGALVYVYDGRGTNGGLTDLTDSLGQPIENPVTTDADGYWQAYVAQDRYYTARYFYGGRQRYVDANILAGTPPVGPNADPNLRTDLAGTSGAALVKHTSTRGASRGVNAVLDDMPWLDSFTGADDTAKFRAAMTAQTPMLRLPPRLMTVDLGTTPLAPTRPITIVGDGGWAMPDIYNNSNCLFMQTLTSGGGNPITVSWRGFMLRGNTAKANCGGGDFYDNGNGKIADMVLKQFNKTTLRFKYGVNIALDNLRIAGVTGQAAPVVELTGDGSAVGNGALVSNVYITGGGTAFRVYRFRGVQFVLSKAEYFDTWGLDAEAGDGACIGPDGLIFENNAGFAGNRPYHFHDYDHKGFAPGYSYGVPLITRAGTGPEDLFHQAIGMRFAWMYGTNDFACTAAAWATLTFNTATLPYAKLVPTTGTGIVAISQAGDYKVSLDATPVATTPPPTYAGQTIASAYTTQAISNPPTQAQVQSIDTGLVSATAAIAKIQALDDALKALGAAKGREVRARLMLSVSSISAGAYIEVPGSDTLWSVPAGHAVPRNAVAFVSIPAGSTGAVKWEVSASNADVVFSTTLNPDGANSPAAPTQAVNRRMLVEYLGTVR